MAYIRDTILGWLGWAFCEAAFRLFDWHDARQSEDWKPGVLYHVGVRLYGIGCRLYDLQSFEPPEHEEDAM
jgi:hypothetical protein